MILLSIALGIFAAALQYHLNYMVIAFAITVVDAVEVALAPVIINYACESFVSYSQEVVTVLDFFRLILGLTVTFYIDGWVAKVGPAWMFGMSRLYCDTVRTLSYD